MELIQYFNRFPEWFSCKNFNSSVKATDSLIFQKKRKKKFQVRALFRFPLDTLYLNRVERKHIIGMSYFCFCTTLRLLSSSLFKNCCFRPNSCDDARSASLDARGNVGKPGKIARLCWLQAEENKVTCWPTSWSGKNDLLHPLPLTSSTLSHWPR